MLPTRLLFLSCFAAGIIAGDSDVPVVPAGPSEKPSLLVKNPKLLQPAAPTPMTGKKVSKTPATAAIAAAGKSESDRIILDNRQTIVGTILSKNDDDGFIEINTGSGTMRIRKDRVKDVVLGLEGEKRQLDSTNYNSLVKFARWCLAHNHNQEALDALDKAVAMSEVDLPTRALHAGLVDELRGPEAAFLLYRAYRQAGGTDSVALARLTQLEQALIAHDEELKKLGLPSGFAPSSEQQLGKTQPKPTTQPANHGANTGIEGRGWAGENEQFSNPLVAKVIDVPEDEGGGRALAVTSPGGTKDKAAIRKPVNYTVGDENTVLSFFVRNRSDHPLKLAIAVKTGNYDFFESVQQTLAPSDEFKEVRFNLTSSTFKSAATQWANTTKIADLNDVKELQVLLYNGKESVDVLIRGMGFVKDTEL